MFLTNVVVDQVFISFRRGRGRGRGRGKSCDDEVFAARLTRRVYSAEEKYEYNMDVL